MFATKQAGENMTNKQVSKEQIERARNLDLLSYLQQYEPQELVRIGGGVYSMRSHDSLKISNGKWYRWSRGYGGVSALDYLVKVREMDFVSAVRYLCDKAGYSPPPPQYTTKPPEKKPFRLPPAHKDNDSVIAYLMARGISIGLLRLCINMGLIYEDVRHNCVFVGFDRKETPRYAMLRSSDPASTFLREWEGSDKRYSFSLPQNSRETLYLFESAIDCLSFVELQRSKKPLWKPDNYLALSGVYQPRKELSETPLPIALAQFLQDSPHIRDIRVCLDADTAGEKAAHTIIALLDGKYDVQYLPPERGKDYNEQLMTEKGLSGIRTRAAKRPLQHDKEEHAR